MQLVIDITKWRAIAIAAVLAALIIGISADYTSAAGGLLQWHPLSEITIDTSGQVPIITASGNLNSTYLEGPVNVSSKNVAIISRNLSITGSGNGLIFPDGTMQKTSCS